MHVFFDILNALGRNWKIGPIQILIFPPWDFIPYFSEHRTISEKNPLSLDEITFFLPATEKFFNLSSFLFKDISIAKYISGGNFFGQYSEGRDQKDKDRCLGNWKRTDRRWCYCELGRATERPSASSFKSCQLWDYKAWIQPESRGLCFRMVIWSV